MCSSSVFFFEILIMINWKEKKTVIDEKNAYFDEFLIVSNVKLKKTPNSSCYST